MAGSTAPAVALNVQDYNLHKASTRLMHREMKIGEVKYDTLKHEIALRRADINMLGVQRMMFMERSGMILLGVLLMGIYFMFGAVIPASEYVLGGAISAVIIYFGVRMLSIVRTNSNQVHWTKPAYAD